MKVIQNDLKHVDITQKLKK